MRASILKGFSEIGMQAVVNEFGMKELYHPTLFPVRQTNFLSWKSIENEAVGRVAADVVARGTSLREKPRPIFTKIQGDMPKIATKTSMDEDAMYEYDELSRYIEQDGTDRAAKNRLIELWRNDVKFCYDAVVNRVEWLALQSISRGKVTLTESNNDGVTTEFAADYQLPAERKRGYYGSYPWSTAASAKPITVDLAQAIKAGKAKNINYKFAFMNAKTFADFAATEEVIKMSASFAQNALNIAYIPTLQSVNTALKSIGNLEGLQIVVIDQSIEANGTTSNPFKDNVVLLSEKAVLGETLWKRAIDMDIATPTFYKAESGYVCLKKYAEEEPIIEFSAGIANAMPVWKTSTRSMLLDVKNSSWNEGD